MKDFKEKLGIGPNKRTFGFLALLVIIPLVIAAISIYQQRNSSPEVLAANEVNDILEKVGKIIEIPDETPTVATVSDVNKLSGQEFFAKAQNGDKVIIFPNAQKAILYRPSTDKIVEVAFYSPPADGESPIPQGASAVSPTPTTPVSLRELLGTSPSPVPSPTGTANPTAGASGTPTPAQ